MNEIEQLAFDRGRHETALVAAQHAVERLSDQIARHGPALDRDTLAHVRHSLAEFKLSVLNARKAIEAIDTKIRAAQWRLDHPRPVEIVDAEPDVGRDTGPAYRDAMRHRDMRSNGNAI